VEEVITICPHEEHLAYTIRILKRDLLIAALAASNRQHQLKRFVYHGMSGDDGDEPTADQLMELGVDYVDEDVLAADLDWSDANVHFLDRVGWKDKGVLRLELHLQRMRSEALDQT